MCRHAIHGISAKIWNPMGIFVGNTWKPYVKRLTCCSQAMVLRRCLKCGQYNYCIIKCRHAKNPEKRNLVLPMIQQWSNVAMICIVNTALHNCFLFVFGRGGWCWKVDATTVGSLRFIDPSVKPWRPKKDWTAHHYNSTITSVLTPVAKGTPTEVRACVSKCAQLCCRGLGMVHISGAI